MPNLPISLLPAAGFLDGSELLATVQGGVTKRCTVAEVRIREIETITVLTNVQAVNVTFAHRTGTTFVPTVGGGVQLIPNSLVNLVLDYDSRLLVFGHFHMAWALAGAFAGGLMQGRLVINGGAATGAGVDYAFRQTGVAPFPIDLVEDMQSYTWVVDLPAGTHTLQLAVSLAAFFPVGQVRDQTTIVVHAETLTNNSYQSAWVILSHHYTDAAAGGAQIAGTGTEQHPYRDAALGGVLAGGIGSETISGPHFDSAVGGVLAGGVIVDTYAPVHDYSDSALGGVLAGGVIVDDYAPVTAYSDVAIGGVLAGGDCNP